MIAFMIFWFLNWSKTPLARVLPRIEIHSREETGFFGPMASAIFRVEPTKNRLDLPASRRLPVGANRLIPAPKPAPGPTCPEPMPNESRLIVGDILEEIRRLPDNHFQLIVADPPYFQVLLGEKWDNQWRTPEDYLVWMKKWAVACHSKLRDDGLLYIFGQLGKREHTWIHACSMLCRALAFHDMIVWDRAVGYNERSDSFTPQYEMAIALKKSADARPYFDKDAVRVTYDEATIAEYLRDKRYKDLIQREEHLRKGKYATNILRVPSLKGTSKEKIGHPSQKPIKLIEMLVQSSSKEGDWVLDPFIGSGTTAEAAEALKRKWVGIEIDPGYAKMANERMAKLRDRIAQNLF